MMDEAITWVQNKGYQSLYMHCLSWNQPIKHLCKKYKMQLQTEYGETETKLSVPPPNFASITKQIATTNRNIYRLFLQTANPIFAEVYK